MTGGFARSEFVSNRTLIAGAREPHPQRDRFAATPPCPHPLPFNCNANLLMNALTFSSEKGTTLFRRLLRDLWLCTPRDHQLETITTYSYGSVSVKMSRSLQNKTPLWHDETPTTRPQHCQPPFSSQSKQRLPMRQRSCCHRDALIIATVVGWGTKELQQ